MVWLFEHIRPLRKKSDQMTTSGSGRKWTSSKRFRPHLNLYLAPCTCDPIDQNTS